MGLDNIPHEYPCVNKKTAVMVTGQIDCKATQEAGGCPWQNAEDRPQNGHVTGIFGTDCWYRGKYGNHLLEDVLGFYDETDGLSFYGSNADGTHKSASECKTLAEVIESGMKEVTWDDNPEDKDYLEYGHVVNTKYKDDCEYAAWWLRWVAAEANGTDCWY
jgi:hypothetical protein